MLTQLPPALSKSIAGADWRPALAQSLDAIATLEPDLLVLFTSYLHERDMLEIAQEARARSRARSLFGASGAGIIGTDRELERAPAITVAGFRLPGAVLQAARIEPDMVDPTADPTHWRQLLGFGDESPGGILLLADPFQIDAEAVVAGISAAYPGTPVSGGIASPGPHHRHAWLFLDDIVATAGAVALAIGGGYRLVPIVSQGCEPIGHPWTITGTQHHWILTISNRPALDVLRETLAEQPEGRREIAPRNVLAGLAADEYRPEFIRGDFLVRNLVGIDQGTGAIAINAVPRAGQTIQFQIRDAATADLDLSMSLEHGRVKLDRRQPLGGLLFTCSGRGAQLFGSSHHDALTIGRKLGGIPLAGLFCAAEIGPTGGRSFIHGHTASLALITGG